MSETVIVRIHSGRLTRNTEWFGKMDPYCLVKVGQRTERTSVCAKGGKTPTWQCMYKFAITNEAEILVECWDADTFKKDDLIGTCSIQISQVLSTHHLRENVPIYYKNKKAGELNIELEYQVL